MSDENSSNKNSALKPLPISARGGGFAYSCAVVLYLLVSVVFSFACSSSGLAGTDAAKYMGYLASPIAILIVSLLYVFGFKQPKRRIFPVKVAPKYFVIGLMLIFGLLFSLNSLNELLVELFEMWGYTRSESTLPDLSGGKIVLGILVIAVLPAVLEEALFRGIILNNTEEEAGSVNSVFIVGFLFCLYHGSVEQTIYQFVCGCLFTLLAVRSRSVLPTMLIHFLNNALILVLYACGVVDGATGLINISQGGQIALTVVSWLSLVGAAVWLILDKTELRRKCGKGVSSVFITASVGIVVMAVLWIAGLF